MRTYLESFRGQGRGLVARRLATVVGVALGAALSLSIISVITLTLCVVLFIGFALVVPEILASGACIIAILWAPKSDLTVGALGPMIVFFVYWVRFATHFFHF